jgi:hypothetical protein
MIAKTVVMMNVLFISDIGTCQPPKSPPLAFTCVFTLKKTRENWLRIKWKPAREFLSVAESIIKFSIIKVYVPGNIKCLCRMRDADKDARFMGRCSVKSSPEAFPALCVRVL